MTAPTPTPQTPNAPTIRVTVDPTNPGQFFACCGLLELADRLWSGAEGWFEAGEFRLRPTDESRRPDAAPASLLHSLAHCRVANVMEQRQHDRLSELRGMGAKALKENETLAAEKKGLESLNRESPIHLPAPFDLTIDWFLDGRAGGNRFKTWAGQQKVIDIATAMHRPLRGRDWDDLPSDDWLTRSEAGLGVPFYFDSGLSGQGSAIDAGFSFDPLGFTIPARPLLELAAFVGLQRFRPVPVATENLYRFHLWPIPLLPSVAAAACGVAPPPKSQCYEFRLLYRTDYLKSFLPAQPLKETTHE